jgi:hypothetical protein
MIANEEGEKTWKEAAFFKLGHTNCLQKVRKIKITQKG